MRIWSALLVVAVTARVASAHQSSIKYVELGIDGDRVSVEIKVAPGDVTEPMRLLPDAKPAPAAAAAAPGVPAYVARWLALRAGDAACTAGPATARADEDGFVIVAWTATCPRAIDRLTLDLGVFFALDRRMEAIVRLAHGSDEVVPVVVRSGDGPVTLVIASPSFGASVVAGVRHVFVIVDVLCFVLVLVVAWPIERDGERWRVVTIASGLQRLAIVLAAFMLAHGVALGLAALGWIALPDRLIATLAAATIVYAAAETVVRPPAGATERRARVGLAFVFGLAHGLAAAATVPPRIATVLAFDLGTLVSQLAIAALAAASCMAVARVIGAGRYRTVAMPAFGSILVVIGIVRLVQRAFDM